MWEAVKTRMSGRTVWEWAAVLIFVGVMATFVVYATNPDGNVTIAPVENGGKNVWGLNETVSYIAECDHECTGDCNAGFDENAGLTPSSDDYDNDSTTAVSGTKSNTGAYTLEAECPEDGSHGEPSQIFKVVDIDYLSVDGVSKQNEATAFVAKTATGNATVAGTLSPTATSSELRTDFLNWTKASGSLNFTKSDELTVTVPKVATGSIELEAQAGSYGTEWNLTLMVIEADLDAEGVSDANEASTGAFVIVNDDDDDEDGTEDKSDTNGVTEENDLVELILDVSPSTPEDETPVTLTWTGGTYIAVYENSNRTSAVTSGATYPLTALPKTLYVEGVAAGTATLNLAYSDGVGITSDSVLFTVGTLGMYRDSACGNVLDDWPADTDSIRSPKYIFGEEEGIYAKVTGLSGMASNYYDIVVENLDQSGNTVNLDMNETTPSGTYKNTTAFYLADTTSTSPLSIKVVEEEVLSFIVKVNDVEIGEKSVMVDRGEFASAAARSYDSLLNPSNGDNRTPLWNTNANTFDAYMSTGAGLDWSQTGSIRGYYEDIYGEVNDDVAAFILNAGTNTSNNLETDFFYVNSHGDEDGDGILSGTQLVSICASLEEWDEFFAPSGSLNATWNMDLDWAIIKACNVIKHDGEGRPDYEDALENSDRYAHGILSFEGASASQYEDYVEDFMGNIGVGYNLPTCWIYANTPGGDGNQPYGMVYHSENGTDVFQPASDGVSLTADVNTTNYTYAWRDESNNTGNDGIDGFDDVSEQWMTVWLGSGKTQKVKAPIAAWKRPLNSVVARGYRFDLDRLNPDKQKFSRATEWKSNRIKLTSKFKSDGAALTEGEATAIGRNFITENDLPDAVLEVAQPMYVERTGEAKKVVGYTLVFKHHENGILVAGDGMTMIVQADGVTLLGGFWHEIESIPGKEIAPMEFDQTAMEVCARSIMRRFNGFGEVPGVKWVRPAYYVGDIIGNDEAPARAVWEVCFEGDRREYWDPAKREVIDLSAISKAQRGVRVRNGQ